MSDSAHIAINPLQIFVHAYSFCGRIGAYLLLPSAPCCSAQFRRHDVLFSFSLALAARQQTTRRRTTPYTHWHLTSPIYVCFIRRLEATSILGALPLPSPWTHSQRPNLTLLVSTKTPWCDHNPAQSSQWRHCVFLIALITGSISFCQVLILDIYKSTLACYIFHFRVFNVPYAAKRLDKLHARDRNENYVSLPPRWGLTKPLSTYHNVSRKDISYHDSLLPWAYP